MTVCEHAYGELRSCIVTRKRKTEELYISSDIAWTHSLRHVNVTVGANARDSYPEIHQRTTTILKDYLR